MRRFDDRGLELAESFIHELRIQETAAGRTPDPRIIRALDALAQVRRYS